VRLALSNDVLKTRLIPALPAVSLRAEAISNACSRLSRAQGPAISASGRVLPKRAVPIVTIGLGAGSARMACDHAPALFGGQPSGTCQPPIGQFGATVSAAR